MAEFGKASAVEEVAGRLELTRDHVAFAGDSGNDRDALLAGNAAILVGNAPETLKEEVLETAGRLGLADRVYVASARFSSGVIEGLAHYGLPAPDYAWSSGGGSPEHDP